ncbi:AMP-binding protein [Actinophytocola gossypii]|uniref:AMP-binding protein n=1 Tax=Actinophytocola gossypii TaxID=2812003 RepID=UPI0021A5AB8C|nr:AMP-binding protein [Actinophytocola gossypii]
MHSLLDDAAADSGDRVAVRDGAGAWTYTELADHSHAVDRWLAERGVRPGDRVLVQARTTRELVAMFHGVSRRGAVFVPLNPAMKTFHLRSVLENADPRLVVVDDSGVERMREATLLPVHEAGKVWRETASLTGLRAASPARPVPTDLAALIYTSGSTAAPKAVMTPHAQTVFAVRALRTALGYRADDVVFCRFPMSWDYGLHKVLLACAARAEVVLAGEESDLSLLRRMRETGATVVPVVPSLASMIVTLAGRDDAPVPPVRMFTNTGAALPQVTIDALRAAFPGVRVVRQFGQTECKRISVMPPDQDTERPGSVGLPLPGTEVAILDQDGVPLPPGETGEIVVTGPHVMPGYWRAPEQTARTFRRDERTGAPRLHTGDYGHLDEDGYLYFAGRRDEMFKRKGIRMSTVEIEAAALDVPGVHAAAALPPTDTRDLTLCVVTELAPRRVLRELARRLEPAKVPAVCRVLDELPLSPHGKNERRKLATMLDGVIS